MLVTKPLEAPAAARKGLTAKEVVVGKATVSVTVAIMLTVEMIPAADCAAESLLASAALLVLFIADEPQLPNPAWQPVIQ